MTPNKKKLKREGDLKMGKRVQTFEQLQREIDESIKIYNKGIDEQIYSNSFAKVQEDMQNSHFFINNERKDYLNKIDKEKEIYNSKLVNDNKEKARKSYDELVNKLVLTYKKEVSELCKRKREYIRNMLSKAPTTDQNNLLSILRMRNELDAIELNSIVPSFFDNYQAMKVLQDIARNNGSHIKFPVQLDCKVLYEQLEHAEEYLLRACDELGKEQIDLTYHAFFTSGGPLGNYDPTYAAFIDLFDSYPQLSDIEIKKTSLTPYEHAKVNSYLHDLGKAYKADPDSLKTLKAAKDVYDVHKEDIELLKLTKYANLFEEIEQSGYNSERNIIPPVEPAEQEGQEGQVLEG